MELQSVSNNFSNHQPSCTRQQLFELCPCSSPISPALTTATGAYPQHLFPFPSPSLLYISLVFCSCVAFSKFVSLCFAAIFQFMHQALFLSVSLAVRRSGTTASKPDRGAGDERQQIIVMYDSSLRGSKAMAEGVPFVSPRLSLPVS
jgi:hypothetical protein